MYTMSSNTCVYQVFIHYCTVAPYDVIITAGNITASPTTVQNGDVLTLICMASGGPSNIFRWIKDGIYTNGSTLIITEVTATDGGLYECIVNNTAGDSSANITIYGRTCISHNTLYIV